MAIPNKAVGYGGTVNQNVFRVTFSTALSSAVKYEMYDGATYPAVGAAVTTANTCMAGTAGNTNRPMYMLADVTNAAVAATWASAMGAGTAGGAVTANRMKGTVNFVTQGGANVGAGGAIRFNMCLEVPSDATTSSTMTADLLLRYTYTGGAPTLTWAFNDASTGTEATPLWTTWTPGTHGIRHCRASTATAGPYIANIPASGVELTTEGLVTT